MVEITNDTSTLNGALSELGETLASNITAKGVSASASDGLTTLANKVLQISGGGSTIIYQPTLDGTESITTIATYTPTITNNTLTNGCGYLSDGWDNTIDWELTFDYYVTGDNNGYLVIPQGTSQRDYKGIQQWYCNQLNFYVNGTKPTGYITNATSCNQWISVKITKIGYVWTVYYDGVQKTQWDTESYASVVDTWDTMCIGLDKNSSSRYATIKNIVVKSISQGDVCQTMVANAIEYINGSGS